MAMIWIFSHRSSSEVRTSRSNILINILSLVKHVERREDSHGSSFSEVS